MASHRNVPSCCCPAAARPGRTARPGRCCAGWSRSRARRAGGSRAGRRSGPGRRRPGPCVPPVASSISSSIVIAGHRFPSRVRRRPVAGLARPRPPGAGRAECGFDRGGDHGVRGTGAEPGLVQAAAGRVQAVQESGLAGLVQDPDDLLPGAAVEPGGVAGIGAKPWRARYWPRAVGWLLVVTVFASSLGGASAAGRPEDAGDGGVPDGGRRRGPAAPATKAVFVLNGWSGWPSARDRQHPRPTPRAVSSAASRAAASEAASGLTGRREQSADRAGGSAPGASGSVPAGPPAGGCSTVRTWPGPQR